MNRLLFSRPFGGRVSRGRMSRPPRSVPVQHFEIELGIGDVVQIGDAIYTVIDIEGGEVTFRIDSPEPVSETFAAARAAK